MWIFGSDYFVSIVEDTTNPDRLWVRGRARGDISRFLTGSVDEITSPTADYLFRFNAPRELVSLALQKHVKEIAYPNFKNSVKANDRHYAYAGVWQEMYDFQRRRNSEEIASYRDIIPTGGGLSFRDHLTAHGVTRKIGPPAATLSKQAKKAAKRSAKKAGTRKGT